MRIRRFDWCKIENNYINIRINTKPPPTITTGHKPSDKTSTDKNQTMTIQTHYKILPGKTHRTKSSEDNPQPTRTKYPWTKQPRTTTFEDNKNHERKQSENEDKQKQTKAKNKANTSNTKRQQMQAQTTSSENLGKHKQSKIRHKTSDTKRKAQPTKKANARKN